MGNRIQKIFNSQNPWLAWGMLLGVCLAAYAGSLNNQFMLDDDVILFGENGVSNKTMGSLFGARQHLFYRPAGHLFLMLSYHLFGDSPYGYHAANLLLFSLITYLFFVMTEILFQDRRLSYLAALLFCLHPMNGMLVNYVTASVISTFLIALQLSFIFFIKFIETPKRYYYVLSILFFALGLLSHEMSMMLPFYLASVLFFIYRFEGKKIMSLCLPFMTLTAIYFIFRIQVFSIKAPIKIAALLAGGAPAIYSSSIASLIAWYFSKLILPVNILFLWTDTAFPNNSLWGLCQLGLTAVILFYFIFLKRGKGLINFALSVFSVGLLPAFLASYAHYPFAEPMIEPHWFYFSAYGFFLLLARGLLILRKQVNKSLLWTALVLSILAGYFLLLQRQNAVWENQETYCRYWLENNTRNMTPFYGLGKALLEKGQYQEALHYFQKGMEVAPKSSAYIYADIGYAYFLAGDDTRAQDFLVTALRKSWRYSVTHYYLGLLFLKQDQCGQAYKAFLEAKRLYPKDKRYGEYLKITMDCK